MNPKQKEQLRKMFRWAIRNTHDIDKNRIVRTSDVIGILLMAINDINDNNFKNEEEIYFPLEEE